MNGKVLIADDEPAVLKSTALMVRCLGYEAATVSEPAKILAAIAREKPGLLLQDLRMPGLNVAGLLAMLRLDPATAQLPVVLFSADHGVGGEAAKYDAWGFLPKPFSMPQLSSLLAQALGPPEPVGSDKGRLARHAERVFHDYWNLLAALTSYSSILERVPGLDPSAEAAVQGLGELILTMESKTDRLRRFVSELVRAVDVRGRASEGPAPGPEAGAGRAGA